MRIWKWTLAIIDLQSLPIPEGARLLTVQEQGDMPQLWALVDEKAPIVHRNFATYGTGNPMPDSTPGQYVGTYQIRGGALVFHVFESFNRAHIENKRAELVEAQEMARIELQGGAA